jgi:hypothetical protein
MQDFYYYFVPETNWGSKFMPPANCLAPSFVRSVDGAGVNLGCPLRLYRALQRARKIGYASLEVWLTELRTSSKHLAAIEEMLWADVWIPEAEIERIQPTEVATYDWSIKIGHDLLHLEAKFRPSDWPRVSDPHHLPIAGTILQKAASQLPAQHTNLSAVGITLMQRPSRAYLAALEVELEQYTHIDAVILKAFTGETTVCSMDADKARRITSFFDRRYADDFQLFYIFVENLSEKEKRLAARPKQEPTETPTKMAIEKVESLPSRKSGYLPELPYRVNIVARDATTGEPIFQTICPRIPVIPV